MAVESKNASVTKSIGHRGFTLLQMLIVVVVIAVIGGMAAYGIAQARQQLRLTNSARLLASYLEKARVDSVRRHPANAADMAGVTFLSATRYQVRMDFDGNGTVEIQEINFDNGIFLANNPIPTRFDWRGRFVSDLPTDTKISFTLQYGSSTNQRTVDVTRAGDVTINAREYMDDVPNVNVNVEVSGIDSGSTVNGNSNPNPSPSPTPDPDPSPTPNPPPTPDPDPSPTPYPSPTVDPSPTPVPSPTISPDPTPTPQPSPSPTPAPCVVTISPSALSIRKSGGVGSLSFTVTGGSGAVSFVSGPSNIGVTETSTYNFEVTSLNTSRGDFTLYFNTPCGSRQVTVSITN